MRMEKKLPQPVCGQEAVNLLNCVSESKFDQEKCVLLLQSLRECVLSKKVKKFLIPSQDHNQDGAASLSKRP
ncbi:Cysteine alpha-hairpin motif superfamily [Arabidopsis thaliana x Arabidopsis arenosa]|uniref:Cysteine alpha-hairpin motif superfamily n=1 Tax=Arabidopsis thaliana x Arabidopsis arenosa TaxID=1240361 RepID=A0A8T1Z1Q0_9BRAS|nr:Cysteine alpha-hairpin motif superfamily [Arabidopsis thaliana x Arabidopsis arenosa]